MTCVTATNEADAARLRRGVRAGRGAWLRARAAAAAARAAAATRYLLTDTHTLTGAHILLHNVPEIAYSPAKKKNLRG